jgi:hypothetical protein
VNLIEFLDGWQERLDARCREINVPELPSVLINPPTFSNRLPRISAVYFLRRELHKHILYIGKASDLAFRWQVSYRPRHPDDELDAPRLIWEEGCHHRLSDCFEIGDVMIHWLELPRRGLNAVQEAMIRVHNPSWNVVK